VRWTLIQLAGFHRLWQSQKLSDEDLQALESAIMQDPGRPAKNPVRAAVARQREERFHARRIRAVPGVQENLSGDIVSQT
jgi:hypothetical protein